MPGSPEGAGQIPPEETGGGDEKYDAGSAIFGIDEDKQREYNALSSENTSGELSADKKHRLAELEEERDDIIKGPLTDEEQVWLENYYANQGKLDFDPSAEDRDKFMGLERRQKLAKKAGNEDIAA